MKNAVQFFVGLLSAVGSALLVISAISLALVEGGTIPTLVPNTTELIASPTNQSQAVGQVMTVTPQITLTATLAMTPTSTCPKPKDWVEYTIQGGETIDSLIEQSSVSKDDFLKANCFRSAPAQMVPGSVVYLPPPKSTSPTATITETQTPEPLLPTALPATCGAPPGWILYTVRYGDNLYRISLAYNISLYELMRANCLTTTDIYAGNRLYVPNRPTITPTMTNTPVPTKTPVPPTRTFTPTFTLPPQTKLDQNITFGPLSDKTLGDPPFSISASSSSGLPVSFAAAGNCTISGSTVTLTGAGSCAITASQAGNTTFNPAPPVTQSFHIANAKSSQTIDFPALADKTFGDPAFAVSASASSGLPVSFSAAGNCTVAGNVVTLTGAGSCSITAAQDGDSSYLPAAPVTQTFQIANPQSSQTIDFPALTDKTFGDPPFAVSASASSGLPVSFSASGSCSIAGNLVTLTATGTCTITASQGGNSNYLPADDVSQSFQIN
jgi:hypothetical protein